MLLSSSKCFRSDSVCKQGTWGERTRPCAEMVCGPADACFSILNDIEGIRQGRGLPVLMDRGDYDCIPGMEAHIFLKGSCARDVLI